MKSPLVSVVIINYNAGKLLRHALDSVLAQTMEDIELIVVDDASKDDGPDVIHEYAARDPRVVPVISRVNRGISATRNAGIDLARGEYIALLDGDDCFLPETLERKYEHFLRIRETYPDLCLLASDAWLVNEQGQRGGRYFAAPYWGKDHVENCPWWSLPSTWFFPRHIPVRFHNPYRFADAPVFIHRMAAHGSIALVGEPLIDYRLRISSATNALAAKVVKELNAAAKSLDEGRLDNPIDVTSFPEPDWRQVAAWKYGRNAKAAMLNGCRLRAMKDLAVATLAEPAVTTRKLARFLQQKFVS